MCGSRAQHILTHLWLPIATRAGANQWEPSSLCPAEAPQSHPIPLPSPTLQITK